MAGLEPCANDLVKIMKDLVKSKEVPNIVIPTSDLGKVSLESISIRDERSVSSRLKSLEIIIESVKAAVEKLTSVRSPGSGLSPMLGVH